MIIMPKRLPKKTLVFMTMVISISLLSCENETKDPMENPDSSDPCSNSPKLAISDLLHAYIGESSGRIEVNVTGGNGEMEFSIDGVNFTNESVFNNLSKGTYTITVRDENKCEETIIQEIKEFPEISFINEVFPIIQTNCLVSGCHLDTPGLPKWDNYTIISQNADRIRFRITGKTMPPSTSGLNLSDEEILTIQNWVDVGAPNN